MGLLGQGILSLRSKLLSSEASLGDSAISPEVAAAEAYKVLGPRSTASFCWRVPMQAVAGAPLKAASPDRKTAHGMVAVGSINTPANPNPADSVERIYAAFESDINSAIFLRSTGGEIGL